MATDVQVSARILRFPQVCCCCGRTPDSSLVASSTRVWGKRVIRTQSKSWSFPICHRCLKHVRLYDEADRQRQVAQRHKQTGTACIIIGILLSFCLVGIPVLIYGVAAVTGLATKAAQRAEELEDEAGGHLSKRCTCHNGVVIYRGWSGSIHSFAFRSESYAFAFIAANRGKVVG